MIRLRGLIFLPATEFGSSMSGATLPIRDAVVKIAIERRALESYGGGIVIVAAINPAHNPATLWVLCCILTYSFALRWGNSFCF